MTHHDRGTTGLLAQFKPNSHNIAERNLTRQGFRAFVPMQEETKRARQVHHPDAPAVPRLSIRGAGLAPGRLARCELDLWHLAACEPRQGADARAARSGQPADAAL